MLLAPGSGGQLASSGSAMLALAVPWALVGWARLAIPRVAPARATETARRRCALTALLAALCWLPCRRCCPRCLSSAAPACGARWQAAAGRGLVGVPGHAAGAREEN